jgi:hypothetical protein
MAGAVLAIGATAGVAAPRAAVAESNSGGHTVVSNQEFRAYAQRGERVRFAVDVARGSIHPSDVASTVTLKGPGGVVDRCRIPAHAPVGRSCVLGPAKARRSGIWQALISATGAPDIEGINGTDAGPAGDFPTLDWDLTVRDAGGAVVHGRVWAPERYSMFNSSGGSQAAVRHGAGPLTLYYLHDNGWLYRARYDAYNGVYSRHRATSLGVVDAATGEPVYRSTTNQDPRDLTIDHPKQDYFKIFFDRPDSSMPASATAWDGRTLVLDNAPAPLTPSVTGLRYVEDDDLASHAGSYVLQVSNHSGVVDVVVDSDLDGRPDADDVRYSRPVNAGPAGVELHGTWDGKAKDGTVVAPQQRVKVWALIDRAGEIHFTNSDVEYRSGIDVRRLNGPATGRTTLYWDDHRLRIDGKHQVSTAVRDGRAGVDSTGGVHGLPTGGVGGGFGWGNERFIDDWTFVPVGIEAEAVAPADLRLVKLRQGTGPVTPGDRITWQVRIGNFGDTVASDTVVTDLDVDATEIDGLALTDPSAGTVDGLMWTVGDLAPNATATVTVTGTVKAGATGPLENRAVTTSPDDPTGPPADPTTVCEDNPSLPTDLDNCDVVRTPVTPDPADLRILKDLTSSSVEPGGRATWRVTVGNFGEGVATDVVMDDLGAYVRAHSPGGRSEVTDLELSAPSKGSVDGVTWSVGDLAPGEKATVTLTGTVPDTETGTLVNRAVVTSPDDPTGPPAAPEPDCEDNTTLAGDVDNCDVVETPFDTTPPVQPPPHHHTPAPPTPPAPATPPQLPPADDGWIPNLGGPGALGLSGAVAALAIGSGLLLGWRRRRGEDGG